jgi:hypothetical protein
MSEVLEGFQAVKPLNDFLMAPLRDVSGEQGS